MLNDQEDCRHALETAAQVLIRCFLGGMILLLVWFGVFFLATDWMYAVNARWFSITREQFVLVNYCGVAALKLLLLVAFLLPYISVRLVLMKRR